MFRCDACGNSTRPREKMHKRVIAERPRVYEGVPDEEGNPRYHTGSEIVSEVRECTRCANGQHS
jgi:hypothetical protein